MTAKFYTVWSYGIKGPALRPVTSPLPRGDAVRTIRKIWALGHMARLEPPLIGTVKT
jgi:hypothetical protein